MRALIISDIHANLQALQAVLEHAPAHDIIWNLGDVVGYGGNPNEVIELCKSGEAVYVRGNHDRACCGLSDLNHFNPIAARAARWTQCVLTPGHLRWLRELPQGPVEPVCGDHHEVRCSHGSLLDEDEYVLTAREAHHSLKDPGAPINFYGHTHLQGGFATDGDQWFRLAPDYRTRDRAEVWELKLSTVGRYMLNPGSVGQPRDGNWRAAYAIYDVEAGSVIFGRVPYDVRAAQEAIQRAGLPERLASRLRDGR